MVYGLSYIVYCLLFPCFGSPLVACDHHFTLKFTDLSASSVTRHHQHLQHISSTTYTSAAPTCSTAILSTGAAIRYRLTNTNHKPQTTNHTPQTTNHKLQITNQKPQTPNRKPQTANLQVEVACLMLALKVAFPSKGALHVTCDVWRVMCDIWRVTCDVWRVTCDVWRVIFVSWPTNQSSCCAATTNSPSRTSTCTSISIMIFKT